MAVGAQRFDEFGKQRECVVEGLQRRDLAADVHVDADHLDARQPGGACVDVAGVLPGDAELVLGPAGGDLPVRPGVDVGIDAHRHRRGAPGGDGAGRQHVELRFGFDVEAVDAGGQREIHLGGRLADAGEQDLRGRDAGGERAAQLALRNDVGAGAELGQRADHRLVGVGLHGVADERVEIGEGLAEDAVVAGKRRGRVAVEGRADGGGDRRDRHVLGVKDAVLVVEMVHGSWFRFGKVSR